MSDDFTQSTTVCAYEVELLVQEGPSAGERHVLTHFPVFVGRGQDADVRLAADADDRMLSRRHLKISVEGGHVVIVDLSTNGTWVEQRQLKPGEPVYLAGGESVRLSPRTRIMLRLLGPSGLPYIPDTGPPASVAAPTVPVVAPMASEEPGIDLAVELLGRAHVEARGLEVNVWSAKKAMVLFACLADGPPGRAVSAERLIDLLWPDNLADARAALQATVSRLRRAFRSADPTLPDPVDLHRGGYRFSPVYRVRCDARSFEQLCEEATLLRAEHPNECAALLEQAVAMYHGPFLDGFTDDWVQARRRTLESRYFDAIDVLAEVREAQGNLAQAVRLFEMALEREPCRERSQLGLMRAMAASGRRDEALRRYHDFARLLKKEMGLGPSPELIMLYETIQSARKSLPKNESTTSR